MRGLHLLIGIVAVMAFLATGRFMRHHDPPMTVLSDSSRLMFRSRHIYILASGLVNLMLGLYMQRRAAGWRGITQAVGSIFLVVSPTLLIPAFAIEPASGFQPEMWRSAAGLYVLFLGCMAHLASGIGKSRRERARE